MTNPVHSRSRARLRAGAAIGRTAPRQGSLQRRLAAAAGAHPSTERALGALARLSPSDAIAWLLGDEQAVRAELTPATLSAALDDVTAAAIASPQSVDALGDVLRRYGDVISARATADIVSALPMDAIDAELREVVRRNAARLPHYAPLLRIACDMAIEHGEPRDAHAALTLLARADDELATMRYVHRMRSSLPPSSERPVRVALLSSYTVDFLVPYVDLECRVLGLDPSIQVTPFNSWTQQVLDAGSELRRFDPEIAFLAVSIDDLVPALAGSMSATELEQAGDAAVERVVSVARAFADWSGGTLVVHAFHSAYPDPLGVHAGRETLGRAQWLDALNARLGAAFRELPRAYVLDMHDVLVRRPGGAHDDPKMRHYASARLGNRVLPGLALRYAGYIAPLKGLTRKCVVLDLDNTLWGGVVGEDGVRGIHLGDTAPGAEYRDFQRYLATLPARGILLAVNSKNNPDDALEVIRTHESMVLREAVFSAMRINWRPKPENMRSIAEELNIGLDSIVFIDDSPEERARMRSMLPEVLTPELPSDPALFRGTIERMPELQTLTVTEGDRARVEQYRARREREQARGAGSVTEFLRSLDLTVEIAPANADTLPRVHQLFQRTNQFNLTSRRHSIEQLSDWMDSPAWRVFTARSRDRFGDHGLVAVALVRREGDAWIIDSFVMSCRVIGYGVETALLAEVCRHAAAAGASTIAGEFIASPKNHPARDFYSRHGFIAGPESGAVERWTMLVARGLVASPPWITMSVPHGT